MSNSRSPQAQPPGGKDRSAGQSSTDVASDPRRKDKRKTTLSVAEYWERFPERRPSKVAQNAINKIGERNDNWGEPSTNLEDHSHTGTATIREKAANVEDAAGNAESPGCEDLGPARNVDPENSPIRDNVIPAFSASAKLVPGGNEPSPKQPSIEIEPEESSNVAMKEAVHRPKAMTETVTHTDKAVTLALDRVGNAQNAPEMEYQPLAKDLHGSRPIRGYSSSSFTPNSSQTPGINYPKQIQSYKPQWEGFKLISLSLTPESDARAERENLAPSEQTSAEPQNGDTSDTPQEKVQTESAAPPANVISSTDIPSRAVPRTVTQEIPQLSTTQGLGQQPQSQALPQLGHAQAAGSYWNPQLANHHLAVVRWKPQSNGTLPKNYEQRHSYINAVAVALLDTTQARDHKWHPAAMANFGSDGVYNDQDIESIATCLVGQAIRLHTHGATGLYFKALANHPPLADGNLSFKDRVESFMRLVRHFKQAANDVMCGRFHEEFLAAPIRNWDAMNDHLEKFDRGRTARHMQEILTHTAQLQNKMRKEKIAADARACIALARQQRQGSAAYTNPNVTQVYESFSRSRPVVQGQSIHLPAYGYNNTPYAPSISGIVDAALERGNHPIAQDTAVSQQRPLPSPYTVNAPRAYGDTIATTKALHQQAHTAVNHVMPRPPPSSMMVPPPPPARQHLYPKMSYGLPDPGLGNSLSAQPTYGATPSAPVDLTDGRPEPAEILRGVPGPGEKRDPGLHPQQPHGKRHRDGQ